MNNNTIITPERAKLLAQKPWLLDLEQLQNQAIGEIHNSSQYVLSVGRLERMLLKTDMLIRFGEFDEAFTVSAYATQSPIITIDTVRVIIEMWHGIKDELSEDFVDKNQELCVNVTAMLERVKKGKELNNKTCNEIINRLGKKKTEAEDVEK